MPGGGYPRTGVTMDPGLRANLAYIRGTVIGVCCAWRAARRLDGVADTEEGNGVEAALDRSLT